MSSGFKSLPLEFWLRGKEALKLAYSKPSLGRGAPQRSEREGSTWRGVLTPKPVALLLHESVSVTAPLLVSMNSPECPGKVSCEDTHARPGSDTGGQGKISTSYIWHPEADFGANSMHRIPIKLECTASLGRNKLQQILLLNIDMILHCKMLIKSSRVGTKTYSMR